MRGKVIMVQGTASHAGKSVLLPLCAASSGRTASP